jgi:hypothetical protein
LVLVMQLCVVGCVVVSKVGIFSTPLGMCAAGVCLAPIVALHCERTYCAIPIVQNPTCHVGHC